FLVDRFLQQVLKFTTDGKLLMAIGTRRETASDGSPFNHPTDVAVAPTGEIYVSDGYGAARVHKFAADGKHLLSWGTRGTGPGEFNLPHSVWVDTPERILVADRENHRVQVFTSRGEYVEEWGGFRQPTDFFEDRDGTLYVGELQHRV